MDYTRRLFSKPLNLAKPLPTVNNVDDFELRNDKLGMPRRHSEPYKSMFSIGALIAARRTREEEARILVFQGIKQHNGD